MADLFASIQPLHAALDYHLERHSVLASNVAHVDTPGFKPNDLARVETMDGTSFEGALGVAMQRTNPGHLGVGGAADGASELEGRTFQDLSAGVGNDGNYVSLDREAAKVASNQMRYDVVSAIVSAELRGMHFAATDAKG
jgi:flagellar basal-body rod protein FlgB